MFPRFTSGLLTTMLALGAALAYAQAPPPAPVSAAKVIVDTPKIKRSFVGTVLPYRSAIIGSAVDGRVEEFPLRPGDTVEANAKVAKLKTDTIDSEIELAKSETKLRIAQRDEMQRKEIVGIAKAQMDAAEAQAKYAESRRVRYEELYRNGQAVTQDEYQFAASEALAAKGKLTAMKAEYENMTVGTQVDKIAQAVAMVESAETSVALLETKKAKHTLRSPFRGVVTKTHTEVGEWLSKGAPAVEVIDIEQVEVEFGVPEKYIARVARGSIGEVTFNALPGVVIRKPVTTIVPKGDEQSRAFPVRILIENNGDGGTGPLQAGMFCSVSLAIPDVEKVLVPKDALVLNEKSTALYVIRKQASDSLEGVAEIVPVKLGESSGQYTQVFPLNETKLTENDLVVVAGNERLRPGQPVRHRPTLSEFRR